MHLIRKKDSIYTINAYIYIYIYIYICNDYCKTKTKKKTFDIFYYVVENNFSFKQKFKKIKKLMNLLGIQGQ